jgi:hypothetical protein
VSHRSVAIMACIGDDDPNGIFSLRCKNKRMIVKASEGKRIILKASEGDHLRSIDRVLGKQISIAGLAVACPNRDEELKVVKKVASSYGETMLDMNADKITIDQVIAICDKMHTTTNRVSKWWQQ